MILKVSDLVPIIADLLNDSSQDFATSDYLLPKMQAAQNQLITSMLENPNIGDIESVIEVPSIGIGVVSLRAAGKFAVGQPLYTLKDVITLEEKTTGMGTQEYTFLTRVLKLPNVVAGATNQMYAWTNQDILLLGATSALDFRVFGTFEPQPLVNGDSVLVPGTATIIQYRTAQIVARLRGNRAMALDYKLDADNAEDSHFNHLIMAQQMIPRRPRAYPRTGYELRYI